MQQVCFSLEQKTNGRKNGSGERNIFSCCCPVRLLKNNNVDLDPCILYTFAHFSIQRIVGNDSSGVVAVLGEKKMDIFPLQKQSEIRRNLFCRPVAEIG